jgi:hypothetical protein
MRVSIVAAVNLSMMTPMTADLQYVILRGGSFDGRLASAPSPPGTLRLGGQSGDSKWSELYIYAAGQTKSHDEYGDLPVMLFTSKRNEI